MSQPPTISYSTGRNTGHGPPMNGGNVLAAGCLLFVLACFYFAFWQLFSDQVSLYYWLDRVLILGGWDKQTAIANTVNFFQTIPAGAITNFNNRGFGMEEMAVFSLNQLPFAAGFGIFVAAALADWRAAYVRWFAAAMPAVAGLWRFVELTATSMMSSSGAATAPRFGGAAAPSGMGVTSMGLGILALAIFLQALVCYFAARIGRPIARWLAGLL